MKIPTISLLCPLCLIALFLQNCGGGASEQFKTHEIQTSSGIAMVLIHGGEFVMGSDQGNEDEAPTHTVSITDFAMDKYEVNQERFEHFMMAAPSHFKGQANPVEQVRWSDAAMFCNNRSREEGLKPCYDEVTFVCDFNANGYRLPTEAEWEYACRAGSKTDYSFGGDPQLLTSFAWFNQNSNGKTFQSGAKKPNAWGLYDLYGNVLEWCNDVYSKAYYADNPALDPRGPDEGKERVLRGGAWNSTADACRSSYRMSDVPGITDACFARDTYGFRCVRKLSDKELISLQSN
ncbi:MAG: formylglycine-generating enzyme family protein [Candidatus Omnitrophica bacterium]|nr:formylglycine-generating enzyme family protein [Candidatus Omnitrophota bacterium]